MQKEQVAMRLPVELDGSPSWSALLAASQGAKWAQPLFAPGERDRRGDEYQLVASLRPTTLVLLMSWVLPCPPVLCVYRGKRTGWHEFLSFVPGESQ